MVAVAFDMALTFGQRVQSYLKDQQIPQYQFAERIGISPSLFSRKLRDDVPFFQKEKVRISQELGISLDDLNPTTATPKSRGRIPVLGMAKAGRLCAEGGRYDQTDVEEWVEGIMNASKDAFAVRVDGDSMEPTFKSGDTLICEPCREGDEGMLTDGRCVVAWLEEPSGYGSGGQIGRWQHLGGKRARLKKDNADYPPIELVLTHERTPGIAVVIEMRRARF